MIVSELSYCLDKFKEITVYNFKNIDYSIFCTIGRIFSKDDSAPYNLESLMYGFIMAVLTDVEAISEVQGALSKCQSIFTSCKQVWVQV